MFLAIGRTGLTKVVANVDLDGACLKFRRFQARIAFAVTRIRIPRNLFCVVRIRGRTMTAARAPKRELPITICMIMLGEPARAVLMLPSLPLLLLAARPVNSLCVRDKLRPSVESKEEEKKKEREN